MLTRTRDIPKPAEPITDARELAGVLATVVTNYPHPRHGCATWGWCPAWKPCLPTCWR